MTHVETVKRDARSYRQGLVLGLTMAEVFLLLVFALLIALATLWHSERQKRRALEQGQPSVENIADRRLLSDLKGAVAATSRDSVANALGHLRNGRKLEPLSSAEKEFVDQVRTQQSDSSPEAISDQWRQLTRAARDPNGLGKNLDVAEAVNQAIPEEKDRSRAGSLIQRGLAAEKQGEHNWPPIINLAYAKDCLIGKAELTPCFETRLRAHVQELVETAEKFNVRTVEIIGHTDEQKILPRNSNLDALLLEVLRHSGNVSTLIPADNAGLGLARAAAVVRVLSSEPKLKGYTLLPLSGGQLIAIDDTLTSGGGGDEPERRRIEIRVRRANSAEPSAGPLTPRPRTPPAVRAPSPRPQQQDRPAELRAPSPRPQQQDRPAELRAPSHRPQQQDRPWFSFGVSPSQAAPAR
jgi:hypothetical protein